VLLTLTSGAGAAVLITIILLSIRRPKKSTLVGTYKGVGVQGSPS
jgi:hypothetical protein